MSIIKRFFFLGILPALVILNACGDDEPTGPIPTVRFEQDRDFLLSGETVTFTNNSIDGASFRWDFGDGTFSEEENVSHSYSELGVFTVTLTVTGPGGQLNSASSTVTVGTRTLTGVEIISIDFLNQDGDRWDETGGPDLLVVLGESSTQAGFNALILGEDFTTGDLPFQGNVSQELMLPFTNVEWTFALVDNDDPLSDLNTNETMIIFTANPVLTGSVDDQTGVGEINFRTADGIYEFNVQFQIR